MAEEVIKQNIDADMEAEILLRIKELNDKLTPCGVTFYDDDAEDETLRHTYWLKGKQLMGITSTLVEKAIPYDKKIPDDKKKAAGKRGKAMHKLLQAYVEGGMLEFLNNTEEKQIFTQFMNENNLIPLACEYLVTDRKTFASSIDLVAMNMDGELCIIDYKTNDKPPINKTALQTSIYAEWLEAHTKEEVKHLYMMYLKDEKSELIELPRISERKIKKLITAFLKNDETYVYDPNPDWFDSKTEKNLIALIELQESIKARVDAKKDELKQQMKDSHYKSIGTENLQISYVKPKVTPKFDTTKFKNDNPDEYDKYTSISISSESMTLKLKKQKK